MQIVRLKGEDLFHSESEFYYAMIDSPNVTSRIHSHDFFELFLVAQGQATHIVNDVSQILDTGSLTFIRPDDVHYYENENETSFSIVNLAFSSKMQFNVQDYLGWKLFEGILLKPTMPPCVILSTFESNEVLSRLEKINTFYADAHLKRNTELKVLLAELVSKFTQMTLPPEDVNMPQWLAKCCSEMQKIESFTQGLSFLYQFSGKTPEHVTRTFKKHLGSTPTQYINNIRLNYTKNLLASTDQSIIDICYKSGFESLSHFNHVFKAQLNITPSAYRRRHRKIII